MKKRISAIAGVILCCCFVAASSLPARGQQQKKRKITAAEVKAVIQAAEDEIYDYGYQENFEDVGDHITLGSHKAIRMRIYINPEINADETGGEVIYKLMPYGEVYRTYGILDNGLVVFSRDPDLEFPPTEEFNTKTVYMNDDEVCRMKRDWLKTFFVVDETPDTRTLDAASRRQKMRTGYSNREDARHLKASPKTYR